MQSEKTCGSLRLSTIVFSKGTPNTPVPLGLSGRKGEADKVSGTIGYSPTSSVDTMCAAWATILEIDIVLRVVLRSKEDGPRFDCNPLSSIRPVVTHQSFFFCLCIVKRKNFP